MKTDELGERCLVKLVAHVLSHEGKGVTGITYQDLAREIGYLNKNGEPQPRLGKSLGKMGHLLATVDLGWNEEIPHIQALVIAKRGKNKGMPDDGLKEFWHGYEKLSHAEKENKARAEWQKIAEFGSRWNVVLERLNLGPIQRAPSKPRGFGTGGESPAHKALKEYISNNPKLIDADAGAEAFLEYALPSLDKIDVLFKASDSWTAVEVKSSVSDGVIGDYERGVYQIVKYSAILEAMRLDTRYPMPKVVRTILVLETSLPATLSLLADRLGIEVYDHVKPSTPLT